MRRYGHKEADRRRGSHRWCRRGTAFIGTGAPRVVAVLLSERLLGEPLARHHLNLNMKLESADARADMARRLNRIEGQLRGIRAMIESDRDCREIVQQLNAASAAMKGASHHFVRAYARECLFRAEGMERADAQLTMDDLVDMMASLR
jgi:DNA-binding FrmR family transcriptional regulator